MVILKGNERSFIMTTHKRKRGRPLGSCKDDSHLLAQVADILVSDRKLKPTTAIKRVLASPDPSPIRRLQSKWKQEGSAYLEKARNRAIQKAQEIMYRELAPNRFTGVGAYPTRGLIGATHEAQCRIAEIMKAAEATSASLQTTLGLSKIGATHEMLKMQEPLFTSAIRAIKEPLSSPIVKALQDIKRGL
jgi:hypothetical protein